MKVFIVNTKTQKFRVKAEGFRVEDGSYVFYNESKENVGAVPMEQVEACFEEGCIYLKT